MPFTIHHFREDTHPSFKVDTEKNLWIDYAEGRGGSIIDLCMRLKGCTLSEAIRILGQNAPDITHVPRRESVQGSSKQESIRQAVSTSGVRRLIEVSDTLPPHLLKYLEEDRCINLEKAMPFLRCNQLWGKRAALSKPSALPINREVMSFEIMERSKGTIAPKDITPIFSDRAEPVCIFEGFIDFLSFLSMKEEVIQPLSCDELRE